MENSDKNNQPDHTLLMVISSKMDDIRNDIREIKDEMKFKVHVDDFTRLEKVIEENKKDNDTRHKEIADKVNSHTVKISIGGALLTGVLWLLNYFK